jgi:hypothetical protein
MRTITLCLLSLLVACPGEPPKPPPIDSAPVGCATTVPRYPCATLCTALLECAVATPTEPAICQCTARVQSPVMPGLVVEAVIDCFQAP